MAIRTLVVTIGVVIACSCTSQLEKPVTNVLEPSSMPAFMAKMISASENRRTLVEVPVPTQLAASPDLDSITTFIGNHPDYRSYHLLFVLQKNWPDVYAKIPVKKKGAILCSAMKNVKHLNDWGYLDPSESYDGEAALALIKLGKDVLPLLRELISDKNKAPLFGSEEATMSRIYDYRRADFAYRYIMIILGRKPRFAADSTIRDQNIADLEKELGSLSTLPP